jgi:uncharacterized protein YndB with AHSA1/START domain
MANLPGEKRVDAGSRFIKASPQTIYQAYMDPQAIAEWRPPDGMRCEILEFEPHAGGKFRMAYVYTAAHPVAGKTAEDRDIFEGRFTELVPGERIVEVVEFESDDPAFAGEMSITTLLAAKPGGTEVTVLCENVPPGIQRDDHLQGINSSLQNLAAFTEKARS